MATDTITIFTGRWNDVDYCDSLSIEDTTRLVESHFAFGDPSNDNYAVGNKWASENDDSGWRIVERKVTATVVPIEVKTSEDGATPGLAHEMWARD